MTDTVAEGYLNAFNVQTSCQCCHTSQNVSRGLFTNFKLECPTRNSKVGISKLGNYSSPIQFKF